MKSRTTSKIILCEECDGRGEISQEELDDYHRGTYFSLSWHSCRYCDGKGRLKQTTTTKVEKIT